MRRPVPLLVVAFLLSGCAEDGGSPAGGDGGDGSGGTSQGPGLDGALAGATRWDNQTFTGRFTTTAAFDAGGAVLGEDRTFTVPRDAARALLAVSLATATPAPGEFNVRLIPPDCSSSDCFEEKPTSDGRAEFDLDGPEGGDWQLAVFSTAGSGVTGDYTVDVAALVPA